MSILQDEWVICRIFHKLGLKKSNGGQNYPHFEHHQSTLEPSPSTPKPVEITKRPFHDDTTAILHHHNPPVPPFQNQYLFDDNHQEIHDQDIKSLLNLHTFPTLNHTPNQTMVKPLFPNQSLAPCTHVAKMCKTEAHFSTQELPGANLHRWDTDYIPPTPLFLFEQPALGGMTHFFNGGSARLDAGSTSDHSNVVGTLDKVVFNNSMLPSI
ncbi:uncharacterized protein LOC143627100 [Bidens hawaiensis]|uniref:uncharacterized protein LOC143627100 n=1 Tax=Bidens hawaiensis TaxID=980011 RepID=UPI0040491619